MNKRDLKDIDFLWPLGKNIYLVKAPNRARFPFCNGFLFTAGKTVLIEPVSAENA